MLQLLIELGAVRYTIQEIYSLEFDESTKIPNFSCIALNSFFSKIKKEKEKHSKQWWQESQV